jgi:hypothetical protein
MTRFELLLDSYGFVDGGAHSDERTGLSFVAVIVSSIRHLYAFCRVRPISRVFVEAIYVHNIYSFTCIVRGRINFMHMQYIQGLCCHESTKHKEQQTKMATCAKLSYNASLVSVLQIVQDK